MKRWSWKVAMATLTATAFFESTAWAADRVSGVITRTYVIVEDTDLIGDVTCDVGSSPCFSFGAPDVELRLNGFTITGKANPVTACGGATFPAEQGVVTNRADNVSVRGPGVLQRFRRHGVVVIGSTNARVVDLTVSTNCAAGIIVVGDPVLGDSFGTIVENNIAVRNGSAAPGFGCGGI